MYDQFTHRWWKDVRSQVDMTFSRDRLVEMYFWMTIIVYEPYYSYSRIMLTKLALYMALMDDIYDNYSTTDESNIFTTALKRLVYISRSLKFNHIYHGWRYSLHIYLIYTNTIPLYLLEKRQ